MADETPADVMEDVLQNAEAVIDQLAANLRMFRAYHRLTQREVAERAEMSRSHVAALEAGQGNPRLRTIASLAFAFNVPSHVLLNRNELPPLDGEDGEE